MSREAQVRFCERRGVRFPPPTLLIALCHSRQQAEQVQARLAEWLEPRGLAFNQDKTKTTHLDQGVDFLGFEIRRFGGKLLTKPSRDAMRQIRNRLSAECSSPARGQRRRGYRTAQSGHNRMGRLLPDRGVQPRLRQADAHSGVWPGNGPGTPTRTSHGTGSPPGTSACSIRPGTTSGCSAAGTPAATSAGSPGRKSSGT